MTTIGRRAVLRGLGGLLISLPVLEGCTSHEGIPNVSARERSDVGGRTDPLSKTRAKRFIALMCPDGVEPALWFPSGGERNFVLNAQNAPLEAVRKHLLLLKGVDNQVAIDQQAAGHGNGHTEGVQSLLTGFGTEERPAGSNNWYAASGPSIDQMLSDLHEASGYVGRARGIHMGEESPGSYSSISIRANGDREDYTYNTQVLFDSPDAASQAALETARLRRKSVLDGVKSDYDALARRISGEDKRRISEHLEALRSIEQRYGRVVACEDPNLPDAMDDDQRRDLTYDIIVAAMVCDASRVATVCFHHSGGGGPQLPFIDVLEDIHELSHQVVSDDPSSPSHASFTKYHVWWSQKTLRLVQRMKDTMMPDGSTLFDDVVIFQGSEISFNHATPDMPFVILAGEKTPFDTGRFLQLGPKVTHTHLLTSLLHAFGHTATRVGDPKYAAGNLDAPLFKQT